MWHRIPAQHSLLQWAELALPLMPQRKKYTLDGHEILSHLVLSDCKGDLLSRLKVELGVIVQVLKPKNC